MWFCSERLLRLDSEMLRNSDRYMGAHATKRPTVGATTEQQKAAGVVNVISSCTDIRIDRIRSVSIDTTTHEAEVNEVIYSNAANNHCEESQAKYDEKSKFLCTMSNPQYSAKINERRGTREELTVAKGICSLSIVGMGKSMTQTSARISVAPVAIHDACSLPHEPPGVRRSQFFDSGWQIKNATRMHITVQAAQKTMTPVAINLVLWSVSPKMRRVKDKDEPEGSRLKDTNVEKAD